MAVSTVTHSTDVARQLTAAESAAFDLLVKHATAPSLDVDAQLAAAIAFPQPALASQQAFWSQSQPGRSTGIGTRWGLTCSVSIRPGAVVLSVQDRVRTERAVERERAAVSNGADQAATFLLEGGEVPERVPSRVITEWSLKSRRRMLLGFASVDWSKLDRQGGLPLGMVTLTYPGDWLRCAPNGRAAKRHLKAFRQAWFRAMGWRLDGAWKLEFQERGAPHFHLLAPVPAVTRKGERFETWLSRTWANVVHRSLSKADRSAHVLEGHFFRHVAAGTGVDFSKSARMGDPKRLAVYFYKHGTKTTDGKEYQHNVPREWLVDDQGEVMPENGPGRFWGFWGMVPAEVVVDLDPRDFVVARRVLRKVARARSRATYWSRARHVLPAGTCLHPSQVKRVLGDAAPQPGRSRVMVGGRLQGGFVIVNDGTALAADLARAVNLARMV